jgi:hypothetical protein
MPYQLLSEKKLERIRAAFNKALPDTAEIKRETLVPDGFGNFTRSEVTAGTADCRVISMTYDMERIYADKIGNRLGYKILLPYGTDILDTDRLIVRGVTMEIVDTLTGGSWQIGITVIAAVVR